MVSVLWKLILIPLLFSWNLNLGISFFEVSILDLLMSFMDSAPMPLEGGVAPSSPGSSQMADQAGPSNAGPSNVGQPDSLYGSFPSVPSGLSPIPDDPSIPSVPSLPSLDSHDGEQSVEQRAPRESHPNPVASPGEEAGPSNQPLPIEAYPYTDTEVIGGESVSAIQLRLLEKYPSPSAAIIERARLEAQDLFEVKVEIIRQMTALDPEGDWMGRGARALDNPRTATGEESLERLFSLLDNLREGEVESQAFSQLKSKVFRRRNDDENSAS